MAGMGFLDKAKAAATELAAKADLGASAAYTGDGDALAVRADHFLFGAPAARGVTRHVLGPLGDLDRLLDLLGAAVPTRDPPVLEEVHHDYGGHSATASRGHE